MQTENQQIEGTYVSKRDGIDYRYEAIWVNSDHGLAWSARVFIKDALFSTPSGSICQVTNAFDPVDLVRTVVHQAIERGASKDLPGRGRYIPSRVAGSHRTDAEFGRRVR